MENDPGWVTPLHGAIDVSKRRRQGVKTDFTAVIGETTGKDELRELGRY